MSRGFNLTGAKALYATFRELPRTVQRNVLQRVLKRQSGPFTAKVAAAAPVGIGILRGNVAEGPYGRLTSRQKRFERQDRGKFEITQHIGTADPAGMMNEFGNVNMAAQPFFRSIWEGDKYAILHGIELDLGTEIIAGAERVARRNRSRG